MPNVDSEPVSVAAQALTQAGLGVGRQQQEANLDLQPGLVITTDPAVGTVEPAGYVVNLLVSAGPADCSNCLPGTVTMPAVAGQTLQQAKTTLALAGLTLSGYAFQASSAPAGTVVQSVPPAGYRPFLTVGGYAVQLILSSGSPAPASAPPSQPSPVQESPPQPSPSQPSPSPSPS